MEKIYIGWAEESILPPKKVMLAGQFYERIAEYVESDITVTAMAVSVGDEQMIIASVDIESLNDDIVALAREKFASLTKEVSPDKLIMNATHTHTSVLYTDSTPVSSDILNRFLPEDKKYKTLVKKDDSVASSEEAINYIADKIAKASKYAWNNRVESKYVNEFGRAAVGMCRRVKYDDGSAQMWGDTNTANFVELEGGNDSGIELLYIFDKSDKLTGVVANVCCPSQVLEHRSFVSSDYWGKVKENLRKRFGDDLYLLALCGAAGDQCPRDLVRWVQPESPINDPNIKRPHPIDHKADPSMFDLSGCRKIGKRIANEIISVYEEITEKKDTVEFTHKVISLDLPLRKATISDYETAVREIESYIDKNDSFDFSDSAAMHVYAGTIIRYQEQQTKEIVPVEIHIVRFGDIAIMTSPFELFLDYGNRIKARSYAKQTFIVQLACGINGYLPTKKAQEGSHYSAYISSGCVGYEGGDILVRKSISEINKLWDGEDI